MYVNTNFQPVCTKWLCNRHMGLAKSGGQLELQPFVLLINFGAVRQWSAFNCPPSPSTQTLPSMLDDHTITTICKVKGGLSTTRLRADFDVIQKCCASFNFLSVDSQPLTFIEKKLLRTDNHLIWLTTIDNDRVKQTTLSFRQSTYWQFSKSIFSC